MYKKYVTDNIFLEIYEDINLNKILLLSHNYSNNIIYLYHKFNKKFMALKIYLSS